MANAPKKTKGTGTKSTEKRAGEAKRPKADKPAEEEVAAKKPAAEPEESGAANYTVPVLLGAAVIAALVYSSRMNRAPAEPPAGSGTDSTAEHGSNNGDNNRGGGGNNGRGNEQEAPRREPPRERPTPPSAEPTAQDVSVRAVHPEPPPNSDPRHGRFTVAEATAGMPAGENLVADIETSMGNFSCRLWPDRAPNTVANFVGLARGTRDWWDPVGGSWVRRPYYDGSVFHRVIPDFMIQGGDILRTGQGGPGYEFADENTGAHDQPGMLCMANHGPNTNGGQFFILEESKPHLNGSYSVFGLCTPAELVERIARTPRTRRDQPLTPVRITRVNVHR